MKVLNGHIIACVGDKVTDIDRIGGIFESTVVE